MSAPVIWILFPLLVSILCWQGIRNQKWSLRVSAGISLILGVMAVYLPVGVAVKLGPISIKIAESMRILGRQLQLTSTDMPIIALLYCFTAFWLIPMQKTGAPTILPVFGMGMVAFIIAAISVEPFLYGAVLFAIVVLISIPILNPAGSMRTRGVLRFLVFQVLAIPLILIIGWMLEGSATGPTNSEQRNQVFTLLSIGLALWLGLFPFQSWILLVSEESHPYSAGFLFYCLGTGYLLFFMGIFNQYAFLRDSHLILSAFRFLGLFTIFFTGIIGVFESHLGRLIGILALFQNGLMVLSLSLLQQESGIFLIGYGNIPFVIGIALSAFSISVLPVKTLPQLPEVGRRNIIGVIGLATGVLTIAGMPLFAGFPPRQALIVLLQQESNQGIWLILGSLGILLTGIRILIFGLTGSGDFVNPVKNRKVIASILIMGILGSVIFGLFPQILQAFASDFVASFPLLIR